MAPGMTFCTKVVQFSSSTPYGLFPAGDAQPRSLLLADGQGGYRARDVGLGGRLVDTKAGERTRAVLEFQQCQQDVLRADR